MPNWKKVIVSGSNANLHHITASGNISSSGKLYGNLPNNDTINKVVVYNSSTGRLEWKTLNLVNTAAAPRLFAMDQSSPSDSNSNFRQSHALGNTSLAGSSIFPQQRLTASLDGGATYTISSASNATYSGLNSGWTDKDIGESLVYSPSVNRTASFLADSGSRDGLLVNVEAAVTKVFQLQSINNTNTIVPSYDSNAAYLNYGNRAFANGGVGKLEIYINDSATPRRIFDMAATPGAFNNTANGVNVDFHATQSNKESITGAEDLTKHYRSGSISILNTHQRDGYNYAYLIHTGSIEGVPFTHITNFSEWYYDFVGASAGGAMAVVNQGVIHQPVFTANLTSSISGIKFYNTTQAGASAKYGARITNQYKNVYNNQGISFTAEGDTIANIEVTQSGEHQVYSKQIVAVGAGSQNPTFTTAPLQDVSAASSTDTIMTASIGISFDMVENDFYQPSTFEAGFTNDDIDDVENIITFQPTFKSIAGHKPDLTLTSVSLGDYMLNQLTPNATVRNFEDFKGETYRLVSRSYATTDTSSIANHSWSGEKNVVNGGAGYNSGSIQYYSHLLYPTGAGVGGVFNPSLGPAENVGQPTNYDEAAYHSSYFRYFKMNSSDNGAKQITIEMVGDGRIVKDGHATQFANPLGDAIKVYIWRSNGPNSGPDSNYTGTFLNVLDNSIRLGTNMVDADWLPLASSAQYISYNNNFTNTSGVPTPTGVIKLEDSDGGTFNENDFIILKIVTPQKWGGSLDAISVRTGTSETKLLSTTGFTPL